MNENHPTSINRINRIRVDGRLLSIGDWVIVRSDYHQIRVYGLIVSIFIVGGIPQALVKFRTFLSTRRYSYCKVYSSHLHQIPDDWSDITEFSDTNSDTDISQLSSDSDIHIE